MVKDFAANTLCHSLMRVMVILMIIGDLTMDKSPIEEDIMMGSGRPLDRGNDHGGGYSRRGRPPDDGGPPDDGDALMMETP